MIDEAESFLSAEKPYSLQITKNLGKALKKNRKLQQPVRY